MMIRYYFLSKNIDVTEAFDHKLRDMGLNKSHVHVYGVNDEDARTHDLTPVFSLMRLDILHYLFRGLLLGLLVSGLIISALYFLNINHFATISIAVATFVTGFITWESGLIGMHKTNYKLQPFQRYINSNQHILFVDAQESELPIVDQVANKFSNVKRLAVGSSTINPFE
ncbi:hypothetical protein tloyanaT_15610 [Thalassotalea loyana]|uniref:Uncharacterized protein n=1 Tax=Thalassotalea loyana TaxID=280483 RepID=A0ABQ6HCZ4_9GAMM|nr:hypothetical protein [Thalassotalea loyana]GLX85309.1 hypothetical protein tloyanaT_15610 [Thalassotalea loyana]